jgi:acetoin utilization protein AcuA
MSGPAILQQSRRHHPSTASALLRIVASMFSTASRFDVWCSSSDVNGVIVPPGFAAVVRSERLGKTLASCLDAGSVVVSALRNGVLVGYATLVPSSAAVEAQWRGIPSVWELGALEVAEQARRQHVGAALLNSLPSALPLEQLILFARGLVHHWAYGHAGTSPLRYRTVLVSMLRRVGFEVRQTDDPEVSEHPLNFLAARFGEHVTTDVLQGYLTREDRRSSAW